MINQNKYCVYFHINPIKNQIFYVGRGISRRPFSKNFRNPHKVLKPGTDKGSTQAMIDTKDFKLAADEILKIFYAE